MAPLESRSARFIIVLLLTVSACSSSGLRQSQPAQNPPPTANVFDAYMSADFPLADGFDFAVGDENGRGRYVDQTTGKEFEGWYVAVKFAEHYSLGIHTGEDWNGNGGHNTDLGQDVYAVANGRVVFAQHCGRLWGNVVIIEHHFYVNHERQKIMSLYAHLNEIKVGQGQDVRRRQVIATIGQDPEKLFSAHLHLELRWNSDLSPTYWPSSFGKDENWIKQNYAEPTEFIQNHRRLPLPQNEPTLVLVDHSTYRARLYQRGVLQQEYDIAFGQGRGQKMVEGDNKTPKGMYFVVEKYRGRFDQPYGEYYGGHWIKINYPNKFDAERGHSQQMISDAQAESIKA